MTPRPVITLLTDFGSRDPYVGMMKGVIAGICPEANVIDVTHEVPPQDVRVGAFFLERAARYFPPGTVHVAVVDPGVGTTRAPIALEAAGQFFVGPDNGLLCLAAARYRAVRLEDRRFFLPRVSTTFHGRDVFAPVAARIAQGEELKQFGPSLRRIVKIPWPRPRRGKRAIAGEIVAIDRFGNLITNLEPADWRSLGRPRLSAGAFSATKLCATYASVPKGQLAFVVGGYGLIEIAAREASAEAKLGLRVGDPVRLRGA